jgi:hypothetical protein
MNYRSKTKHIYKKHKIEKWLDDGFTEEIISRLKLHFAEKDLSVC